MKGFWCVMLLILSAFISGCYSVKTVKLGTIDGNVKSIEIPPVGFSVLEIKDALSKDGWKIKVSNSNVGIQRLSAYNPKIDEKNDYDATYRMNISESVRADMFVIGLSTSIVDNRNNQEVLNMYFDSKGFGGCWPEDVAKDIVKELRSIQR